VLASANALSLPVRLAVLGSSGLPEAATAIVSVAVERRPDDLRAATGITSIVVSPGGIAASIATGEAFWFATGETAIDAAPVPASIGTESVAGPMPAGAVSGPDALAMLLGLNGAPLGSAAGGTSIVGTSPARTAAGSGGGDAPWNVNGTAALAAPPASTGAEGDATSMVAGAIAFSVPVRSAMLPGATAIDSIAGEDMLLAPNESSDAVWAVDIKPDGAFVCSDGCLAVSSCVAPPAMAAALLLTPTTADNDARVTSTGTYAPLVVGVDQLL
jgi:hypothetical protein